VEKIRTVNFLCFRWYAVRGLLAAMNVADSIWNKLTRVVVFLLLLAVLVGIGVWYYPLIQENGHKRKDIERLDELVRKEKEIKRTQEASIEALKDSKAVERLIRNTLLYAKTNEIVIRFDEPVTNSAATRLAWLFRLLPAPR
jgi:cell division protein FtsB